MFDEEQIARLMGFLGYGALDADVWFIGMEEAAIRDENAGRLMLETRTQFDPVMDLWQAHQALGIRQHHEGNRKIQKSWSKMCGFMLLYGQEENTKEARRTYQAERLGNTQTGNTFLAEILPIPVPSILEWPEYLNEMLGLSREEYVTNQWEARKYLLREQITQAKPAIVICYGKGESRAAEGNYWNAYRDIFREGRQFVTIGDFEYSVAAGEEPFVILAHHFTAPAMNGDGSKLYEIYNEHVKNA